ncbi:MAG: hypothetical protein JXA09_06860 [Anaerolineae bacterium]|nr:hypothetical protein [Anaerolineae bacterium]
MHAFYRWITVLSSLVIGGATIATLIAFRRERRIGVGMLLLSIAISAGALLLYVLVSGARTSWLAAGAALALGLALGGVRGGTTRLSWREGYVVGRSSWLSMLVWGLSYAIAHLLNLFRSPLLSSSALILLCLSTGAQVAEGVTMLIRRLRLSPADAAPAAPLSPGTLPERAPPSPPPVPPPPPTLPERS